MNVYRAGNGGYMLLKGNEKIFVLPTHPKETFTGECDMTFQQLRAYYSGGICMSKNVDLSEIMSLGVF